MNETLTPQAPIEHVQDELPFDIATNEQIEADKGYRIVSNRKLSVDLGGNVQGLEDESSTATTESDEPKSQTESEPKTEQAPATEAKKMRLLGRIGHWLVKDSERRDVSVQASKDARTNAENDFKQRKMVDSAYKMNDKFDDNQYKEANKLNSQFDRDVNRKQRQESRAELIAKSKQVASKIGSKAAETITYGLDVDQKVADSTVKIVEKGVDKGRRAIEVAKETSEATKIAVRQGKAATTEQIRSAREYYHRKIANGLNDLGEGILNSSVRRSDKAEAVSALKK